MIVYLHQDNRLVFVLSLHHQRVTILYLSLLHKHRMRYRHQTHSHLFIVIHSSNDQLHARATIIVVGVGSIPVICPMI
jgi:hypothetical protein